MKRVFCALLAMVMVISLLPGALFVANAASKQEKTRAIGIVFDNSGSMYDYGDQAWCRATYAMEVFASMMNDGDVMQIYPMSPINLDGSTREEYTEDKPLVIRGPGEAQTIRSICTPLAQTTPISTITAAYEGLKKTQADERWLIVLTDGLVFYPNNTTNDHFGGETSAKLTEMLSGYSKDMQIMYLGIGSEAAMPDVTDGSRQYYDKASNTADVLSKLTAMCNMIFGRDVLPASGDTLEFDVSMSKLIVFVQGSDVSNVSLSGGTQVSQHDTKYSQLGTIDSRYLDFGVDTSLQGVITIYEDIPAGSYSLRYSGNVSSIGVYYEPDVDAQATLTDEAGNKLDLGGEVYPGTYRLNYGMVDANGDPTASDLLGNVSYSLTYTVNGVEQTVQSDEAGFVELEMAAGDTLDGDITVTYLSGYTIHKDSADLGWPFGGITFAARPAGAVVLEVTGGQDSYDLSKLEQQAVYQVKLWYDGQAVTGGDLDRTELKGNLLGGNAKWETKKTGDGYEVYIQYYNGSAVDTACGDYTLSLTATYTNEDGQTGVSPDILKNFTLNDDSKGLSAAFELEQDYYVLSELEGAEPIVIRLSADGGPLTREQFETTTLTVDMGGLPYEMVPSPEQSAYVMTLKPDGGIKAGRYKLSCQARGIDSLGREVTAEATESIEVQPYPQWLRYVVVGLILLLLLLLIWLFMNAKVLPKKIGVGKCTFVVDGSIVPGSPNCVYAGGGKKRGSLEITSPKYMANPNVKCGFRLELEAESPRRTRSAARAVRVKSITPLNPSSTTSVHVGSANLVKDPITGKLAKSGAKPNAPIDFAISNNAKTSVTAEVLDVVDGNDLAVSMSVPLKFY